MIHKDGTMPGDGWIFVFGSNLKGAHGAGAAKAANVYFGAKHGIGIGRTGMSYAIPTKDENIITMDLDRIRYFVTDFNLYAEANSDLKFFVTAIGCGLAGLHPKDIAPMFKVLSNTSFPDTWESYLIVK